MDNSPTVGEYKKVFEKLQSYMNSENEQRVLRADNEEEWDLIQSITIEPNRIVLKSDFSIIEFDTDFNLKGKVKKNRRKRYGR